MDYSDYGYVAIDTQFVNETSRDPVRADVKEPQNCIFINGENNIDFEDDIFIRRFYWESFDHLPHIVGNHCILTGNTFYIINNDPNDNINSITSDYIFLTNKHTKITLTQQGPTSQLRRKISRELVNFWLHKIVIDISQLNLPDYYYHSPINNVQTFGMPSRTLKFAPQSEAYIFDQNLSLFCTLLPQIMQPCMYNSFIQELFNGTDYRFGNKYSQNPPFQGSTFSTMFNNDVQPVGVFSHNDTLKSFSSECSFIAEKMRLVYGISKINTVPLQYNNVVNMVRNTSTERTPGECHTISTEIDRMPGINQNSWKPTFYNFGDFIIRPLFLAKYLYLLNMIHDATYTSRYSFGLNSQYTIQKIINDFQAITGSTARIPIYDEPQTHWGGNDLATAGLPRGRQQMNRVGRIWQFILNPIIVKRKNPTGLEITTNVINLPTIEYLNVYTLPYSDMQLTNMAGTQLSISQLWESIDIILKSIIDTSLKSALRKLHSNDYILLGGKAINNIISEGCLQKSFDFDIHLMNDANYVLSYFGQSLCNKLNDEFNLFRQYRKYLFNILLGSNLVLNNDEYKTYYDTQKLFYFGHRLSQNRRNIINGIFIKLKLRNDIFPQNITYNYQNEYKQDANRGIIYYVISDVEYESVLNFGLQINTPLQRTRYDNLWYPKYAFLVFNLIKYVDSGGYKRERNLNKLIQFFNIPRYSCRFISTINSTLLQAEYDMIPSNTFRLANNLRISEQIQYVTGTDIKQIINDLIHMIINNRDNKLSSCRILSVLNKRGSDLLLFLDTLTDVQKQNQIQICSNLARTNDINGSIHLYTGGSYLVMNVFLQFLHLNLPVDNTTIGSLYGPANDNVAGNINITEQSIRQIIDSVSTSIQTCNNAYTATIRDDLKDNFFVYRAQTYVLLNDPLNDSVFDINILTSGRRIAMFIPHFVSASFSHNFSYESFVDNASFILKIKINKNTRKWIILNGYSNFPEEKEILIDKNCIFLITGYGYQAIELHGNQLTEKLVINATLFDDMKDCLNRIDNEQVVNSILCDVKIENTITNINVPMNAPLNVNVEQKGRGEEVKTNLSREEKKTSNNKTIDLINFTDDEYKKFIELSKYTTKTYNFNNKHTYFMDITKSVAQASSDSSYYSNCDDENIFNVKERLHLYDLYQTYFEIPSKSKEEQKSNPLLIHTNIKEEQKSKPLSLHTNIKEEQKSIARNINISDNKIINSSLIGGTYTYYEKYMINKNKYCILANKLNFYKLRE
jgi:hypothetical protein